MRALILCLALLLVPLPALAKSEGDRGFIQGLLEDALSGPGRSVRIAGFEGALSSRATIAEISVADRDGVWLTMTDVALVWNRSALLSGRIEIGEISVGALDLPRPPLPMETDLPSPEARGSFALPNLPVSVSIDALRIDTANLGEPLFGEAATVSLTGRAELADGAGAAELAMTRLDAEGALTLDGRYDNATRQLRLALEVDEPANGVAVNLLGIPERPSLRLTARGDDPIDDFEARVQLATDGQERLAGTVTLRTEGDGTARFGLDLGGDLAPVFAPAYRDFLGDSVALRAEASRDARGALVLEDLTLTAAALRLTGLARIGADGWPERLSLDGRITPPAGDRVVLPLPGPPVSVTGVRLAGQFDASSGDAWQINGTATGVQRTEFSAERLAFSGAGEIGRSEERVAGSLQLNAAGLVPADPALARAIGSDLAGRLGFDWSRGAPLRLTDIDLGGTDYGLTGALTVTGLEGGEVPLILQPDARLRAADLTRFGLLTGLELSGAAQLDISGRVAPLTGALGLRFEGATDDLGTGIGPLDPLLAGDGALMLVVTRDEEGLRADPLRIETPTPRISGAADLKTGASRATLALDIPDVAVALPGLAGSAQLDLRVTQSGLTWQIAADAALPGDTSAALAADLVDDTEGARRATGRLTAEIGRLSAFSRLAGRPLSGAATLSATGQADLDTGAYSLRAQGRTRALAFAQPLLEPLLRGTTAFDLVAERNANGALRIDRFDLSGPGLSADLSGAVDGAQSRLDYRLSVPELGLVVPDLPGAASVTGTARRDGGPWRIDASGTGPGDLTLNATGTVSPDARRLNLALNGGLPLALANPQLSGQTLSGQVAYDLSVVGPPALRSVSGRLAVSGGRFSTPALNLAIDGIAGPITLSGGQARLDLSGRIATGGRVTLSGPVALSRPFGADLGVQITGATLRDRALYEADLGGRLTLTGPLAGGARIGGRIDLATVELRIPRTGPSYSALEGLRHIGPPTDVRRTLRFAGLDGDGGPGVPGGGGTGPRYPIDLLISAPNRVFVRGRGLDAELGGQLRLTGTTADIVPGGQFDLIRGRLDLLTRRLTLSEGAVQLRGSFDPVIRFAAVTTVDDTEITIRLDGLASAPELSITAVPDLPQDEALSLFLFGRDATSISPLQAIQLAAALRTLTGKGLGLTENIRMGLGVDDFDISTDDEGNAQARVGAYLSDNVYTDVTVNSDGESQINLNLDVTPDVTMRGRLGSDGDSGIGVFWERDY